MSPPIIVLVGLFVSIILMVLGFHIALSLSFVAIVCGLIIWDLQFLLDLFALRAWGVMSNFPLMAIPLFVFMGTVLQRSGVAEKLFDVLYILLGKLRGSLALMTIVIGIIFGACTGIAGAAVVTLGLLGIPIMLKRNYQHSLIAGSICAGAGLGVIIPPSVVFILYGSQAGVSISMLFAAGILPGLLLGGMYFLYIFIRYNFFQPHLALPVSVEERGQISKLQIAGMFVQSVMPPIILIFAVLGAIFTGWSAPTEAAALGAVGSLIIAIVYKKFNRETITQACYATMKVTSAILFIVFGADMFAGIFLRAGASHFVRDLLIGMNLAPMLTIIVMILILYIGGMFMDWIGMIYIFIPIFSPIVATLGFDPIWFGVLFCVTLQLSYLTPPFAYNVFYLKSIAPPQIKIEEMYVGVLPFIAVNLVTLAILMAFPDVILYIPNLLVK